MYEAGQLTSEHLAPELALILAAWRSPRPLAACQVPGLGAYAWCHPRFFGITSADRDLRVLLCELLTNDPAGLEGQPTLGTVLRYLLFTPGKAAQMITSWARLIPENGQGRTVPTVTVLAHGQQAQPVQERFEIQPGSDAFNVTRIDPVGEGDPEVTLDETSTVTYLASALTRMAR
jgi:hypothetical protein